MLLRRVCIGLSGGVDSTVAALMLSKQRRIDTVAVFMRNWDKADEDGFCSADADAARAEDVARRLQAFSATDFGKFDCIINLRTLPQIPFKEVNFVKEYWNEVFTPMVDGYQDGITPNPDILCNSRIKFKYFHDWCFNRMGCDAVATGHYAQNSLGENLELAAPGRKARLLKAFDQAKDQTFFLSQISQEALQRSLFPVGGLPKEVVKKIAVHEGFTDVAQRKESMGICFIGKRKHGFQHFIADYAAERPGEMMDVDTGEIVGTHQGLHHWTLGQGVALQGHSDRAFVVEKDASNNRLWVCNGVDHPALFSEHFFTFKPHWICEPPEELYRADMTFECDFRYINVDHLRRCTVSFAMSPSAGGNHEAIDEGKLIVSSSEPIRAVTPGQYAVFYRNEECLGSAMISKAGPSLFTMGGGSPDYNKLSKW